MKKRLYIHPNSRVVPITVRYNLLKGSVDGELEINTNRAFSDDDDNNEDNWVNPEDAL